MQIIDGAKIASEIIAELKKQSVPKKFLAGIVIGKSPASLSFQKIKEVTGKKLGVDYRIYQIDAQTGDEAREKVRKICSHKSCGGALVQLPLSERLNRHYVLNAIPREKDVDVMSERALGAYFVNRNPVIPPSAATVGEILKRLDFSLKGKTAAVVGHGFLIGRPVSVWLAHQGAQNVHLIGRGGDFSILKRADLVVLGAGRAALVKPEMLKSGAGVIDFGYDQIDGKVSGDFDFQLSQYLKSDIRYSRVAFITPTPGGTGPILVAKLFENFYKLNSGDTKGGD